MLDDTGKGTKRRLRTGGLVRTAAEVEACRSLGQIRVMEINVNEGATEVSIERAGVLAENGSGGTKTERGEVPTEEEDIGGTTLRSKTRDVNEVGKVMREVGTERGDGDQHQGLLLLQRKQSVVEGRGLRANLQMKTRRNKKS